MKHIDPAVATAVNALLESFPGSVVTKRESSTSVVVRTPSRLLRVYVEAGRIKLIGCSHLNRRDVTMGDFYCGYWTMDSHLHRQYDFRPIDRLLPH